MEWEKGRRAESPPVTDAYFIMDELLPAASAPPLPPGGPTLIDYSAGGPRAPYGPSQPHQPPYTYAPLAAPGAAVAIARPVSHIERSPMRVFCPHCAHAVETRTALRAGAASWLGCVLLLPLFLCCLCCVPFVVPWFKDVHHTCPSCKAEVAVHCRL